MSKRTFGEWLRDALDGVYLTLQSIERVVIDLVSMTTPWLAPIVPAYMVFRNMQDELGFPWFIALPTALAIECLGLAAINTAVEFWRYNESKELLKENRAIGVEDEARAARLRARRINGAPFKTALVMGAAYILIVLTVNVVLDVGRVDFAHGFAKAILSLISVVGGVIIALRASQAQRVGRAVSRPVSVKTPNETASIAPVSIKTKADYFRVSLARNGEGPIVPLELMRVHNITKPTAYRWHSEFLNAHPEKAKHEGSHPGASVDRQTEGQQQSG